MPDCHHYCQLYSVTMSAERQYVYGNIDAETCIAEEPDHQVTGLRKDTGDTGTRLRKDTRIHPYDGRNPTRAGLLAHVVHADQHRVTALLFAQKPVQKLLTDCRVSYKQPYMHHISLDQASWPLSAEFASVVWTAPSASSSKGSCTCKPQLSSQQVRIRRSQYSCYEPLCDRAVKVAFTVTVDILTLSAAL